MEGELTDEPFMEDRNLQVQHAGRYKGEIRIARDFDEIPDDVLEAFEGDA